MGFIEVGQTKKSPTKDKHYLHIYPFSHSRIAALAYWNIAALN